MSDRMTSIHLPDVWGAGVTNHGRRSVEEMVSLLREKARQDKEAAEAILAAADVDFRVETYVGVHLRRKREVIQVGRPTLEDR